MVRREVQLNISRIGGQATWFWLFTVALILLRFLHFKEEIDEPHGWRQCDTAQYIWSMYNEGIDPLHPKVAWMGGYKYTALEFPLPEAVIATVWKVLGPKMLWARLLDLFAFLVASFYFFRIVRKISTEEAARYATVIFMAVPVSLFYSRAIHIDFWAIGLAHGMVWYALLAIDGENKAKWWAVIFGTLAFAIKAPYAFYFILPLIYYAWNQDRLRQSMRLLPLLLIPLAAFWGWQVHAEALNAAAPDWPWLPGYHKFVDMSGWYYGPFEMRLYWQTWEILFYRMIEEAPGWPVLLAVLPAFFLRLKGKGFALLWLAGTLLYVVIFFNLNVIHNYYQLPLIAPFAVLGGMALSRLKNIHLAASLTVLGLIGILSFRYAERNYYDIGGKPVEAGAIIRTNTPENDLVIVSYGGLDVRAPHVLFRARRYGWSVPARDLNAGLVNRLKGEGARWLCTLRGGPPPEDVVKQSISGPCQEFKLHTGGVLSICPL